MPQPNAVTPIGAALTARPRPLSVDEAVRAVLKRRSLELRSFDNEDDMEGPRAEHLDVRAAPPIP